MSAITDFQKKLLTDPETRKEFAANPQQFITQLGIQLPQGVTLPATIPLADIEARVQEVNAGLTEQGITLDNIDNRNTAAVTQFVENTIPLKTKDLRYMQAVHDEFATSAFRAGGTGDDATVAVVAAVVGAVVAVPVAVYGRPVFDQFVRPEMGIQGITSRASGLVVHGPQGMRVEGMNVDQVAQLINQLQRPGGS